MKKFRNSIKELNSKAQKGGKRKYDDDSDSDSDKDLLDDSDSDSEFYNLKYKNSDILSTRPISYWWYDPYVFRIKKYYIPTFVAPLAFHIKIPIYL